MLCGLWLAFTRNLFHNCNFAYSDYWHAGSKRKTTNTNFQMVSRQVDLFRHMADCFTLHYDILQLSHIVYEIRRKWSPIILIIGRAHIRGDGSITNFDRLIESYNVLCFQNRVLYQFFVCGIGDLWRFWIFPNFLISNECNWLGVTPLMIKDWFVTFRTCRGLLHILQLKNWYILLTLACIC